MTTKAIAPITDIKQLHNEYAKFERDFRTRLGPDWAIGRNISRQRVYELEGQAVNFGGFVGGVLSLVGGISIVKFDNKYNVLALIAFGGIVSFVSMKAKESRLEKLLREENKLTAK